MRTRSTKLAAMIVAVIVAGTAASALSMSVKKASTAASQPAADNVKVRIRISNQSFKVSPVDITVTVDGNQIVSKNFDVGSQHNFESFLVDLPEGEHTVVMTTTKGKANRTDKVTITAKMRYIDVMFWSDPTGKFTFELLDEDRPVM